MSIPSQNDPATPLMFDEARAWLFRFAKEQDVEPYTYELWGPITDVWLPDRGLLKLLRGTNTLSSVLVIQCAPNRDVVVWQDGAPLNLVNWLFEGITQPLTQITYSPRDNVLSIGLAVALMNWSDAGRHVSELVDDLFDYLWEICSAVETIRTEPHLQTPTAVQRRRRFQATIVNYPLVTETVPI